MTGIAGHIVQFATSLLRRSGGATRRFPLAVAAIVGLCVLANAWAGSPFFLGADLRYRALAALGASAAAAVAAKLFAEARGSNGPAGHVLSAFCGAGAAGLVWFGEQLSISSVPFIAGLIFLVPLAPFVGRGDSDRFWNFMYWTAIGSALAFLSVFVFVLGLHAVVEMTGYLFALPVPSRTFDHVYTTAGTLIGPLFALGRIPPRFDLQAFEGSRDPAGIGLNALFQFVAIPLTLLTALILHLYAARIVVTQDVPRNELGWIVLIFLFLVLGLRIAAQPFMAPGSSGVGRAFRLLWAPILGVPLVLLAYALWLRIGDEGLTLERYYLVLAALCAVAILVAQLPGRTRQDIRIVAGIPILLLVLSSFGPWGAYDSVARSQAARILALLDRNGVGADGRFGNAGIELASRIYVLEAVGGTGRILPALPETVREEYRREASSGNGARILARALGADESISASARPRTVDFPPTRSIPLAGFDSAVPNVTLRDGMIVLLPEDQGRLAMEDASLTFQLGELGDRFSLAEVALSLRSSEEPSAPSGVIELRGESGRRIGLLLRSAELSNQERLAQIDGTLLYVAAEWRP